MTPTRATALRFLKDRHIAVLATQGAFGPSSSPIFYKVTDSKTLCFVTGDDTRKYKDIIANKQVALSVVDLKNPTAVNMTGKARVVTDPTSEVQMFKLIGQISYSDAHPSTKHNRGKFVAIEVFLERIQYTDYSTKRDGRGEYIFDL